MQRTTNMGRPKRVHRKKRQRKLRRTALEGRPDTLESEPELPRGTRGASETWSSREEDESSVSLPASPSSLSLALALTASLHTHTKTDGTRSKIELKPQPLVSHSPDEMEMTRKLSSLNFSSAFGMSIGVGSHSGSGLGPGITSIMRDMEEVLSETELCSELASATQLDLLPTLSDREIGEEGMDGVQRRARKRPSRRKLTRRTKKQRSGTSGVACDHTISPKAHRAVFPSVSPATQHPLAQNFVRTSSKEGPPPISPAGGESVSRRLSRAQSFRRSKKSKPTEEDPLFCFLSDTSVAPDVEPPSAMGTCSKASQDMEWVEPYYETTPQERDCEEMEENIPNESDLTETTTDSGCDGDDEESSVEGPARVLMVHGEFPHRVPAPLPFTSYPHNWGEREEGPSDEVFHQILEGSLPLLSPQGRYQVEHVHASLSELKHPGLGVRLECDDGDGRRQFAGCGGGRGGRKKRCNPRQLANSLSLREVNQRIVDFIQQQEFCSGSNSYDNNIPELKFHLVSRDLCRTIASLAQSYQLACLVEEHKRRLPVASPRLRMTVHTKMATREEIEPILRQHGHKEAAIGRVEGKRDVSHSRSEVWSSHGVSHSGSASGEPAGVCCHALDENNVGNQMLQGMGWSPGMGLGRHCDGIRSPVKSYLRTKHAGLGFT